MLAQAVLHRTARRLHASTRSLAYTPRKYTAVKTVKSTTVGSKEAATADGATPEAAAVASPTSAAATTTSTGTSYKQAYTRANTPASQAAASSPPPITPALATATDDAPKAQFSQLADSHIEPMPTTELTSHMLDENAYAGIASQPFSDHAVNILLEPIKKEDVEIKPDGLLYLPEIKYRRILNRAFKPGGWGLAPRGPHSIGGNTLSREYALYAQGRFVSQARGEQDFFDEKNIATAMEGCKSNALMRCCKDLGVASEMWDPAFIRVFKAQNCEHIWVKHITRGNKTKIWRKKGVSVEYPYEEIH